MSHEGEIFWHDPDPRAILPLDNLHVSRSLRRTLKRTKCRLGNGALEYFTDVKQERNSQKQGFEIRIDTDFSGVMLACADPNRKGSWIDEKIIRAYTHLYDLGWAHSVETWQEGRLVGGLYGVGVRGLFAGESMFSHETDASKVALVWLVQHMRERGFTLLDVQFETPHLHSLGIVNVAAVEYKRLLEKALEVEPFHPFC